MRPLVFYHANCWDGFCAAWVARKVLGNDAEYVPVQYGQDAPIGECGRDVYILDFSYPRQEMRNIISQSNHVVVLDHHRTAETELAGLAREMASEPGVAVEPTIIFDMNKSGGRLAWEYFFPRDRPSPWLVDYTEDRDLWRWSLPDSKAVNACLRSYPLEFDLWDHFEKEIPDNFAREGRAILRRESQIVDEAVRHASEIEMDGHKILAVNSTVLSDIAGHKILAVNSTVLSDIAGELAKGRPFGACYFIRQDGKRQWSLRSSNDGVDVSEIAKTHGGGGHRNAAGYEESVELDLWRPLTPDQFHALALRLLPLACSRDDESFSQPGTPIDGVDCYATVIADAERLLGVSAKQVWEEWKNERN